MAILTISKEFGSSGTQIGQSVAKLLNYEYISLKQIHEDAKQPGKQWERAAEDYAGGASSLWERFDWSFMSFVALSQSFIFKYALKDNVVIMARGGNVLMRDIPYCLRIRVTAPLEKRVETVALREDISRDLARLIVKKADRELTSALNQMYGGEWDDPATFDFIFNTAQQSLDNVANAVKDACLNKDAFRTDEAVKALQLKAKAYEVKAGIATDPHLLVPTLEVVPQGGGLVVRGVVSSTEEYRGVQDEATRLAGSVPVTFDLHFRGEIKR
ncbi:MAG: cytidylate kinase [Syntrophus sp. PtaU1.Bin208]|nr:MAG: cytidylate kinase [Syntrophus sp. PtaU1.Bin208]